jgi:hypothetical protein
VTPTITLRDAPLFIFGKDKLIVRMMPVVPLDETPILTPSYTYAITDGSTTWKLISSNEYFIGDRVEIKVIPRGKINGN